MSAKKGQIISQVKTGSLAQELDILPGDRLISIDGQPVLDIFDYQVRQLNEELLLLIEKADGSKIEYELEKDEDEDLGLVFDNPLLDDCTSCHNRCIFCFIDQLPAGMRKTLYFKDDDMRMSFLHGNYVTLTNLDDQELDRLISYRFSPMNISVHATDPVVRMRMMRNKHAGELYPRLQKLAAAGIALNCQLVLVPGVNDGVVLEQTLTDLAALGDNILSIAMVPVGVTRYREENRLFPVRVFSESEADEVVETVNKWQEHHLADKGRRTVYAGDEFYLRAGRDFPPADDYEEYPQLENGVGMAALFLDTVNRFLADEEAVADIASYKDVRPAVNYSEHKRTGEERAGAIKVILATGTLASRIIRPLITDLANRFGLDLQLISINNDFFGHTVSVAGLVTGQDLQKQLKPLIAEQQSSGVETIVMIPDCMLKSDEDIFLDDMSLQDLSDGLGTRIAAVPEQAEGLINALGALASEV